MADAVQAAGRRLQRPLVITDTTVWRAVGVDVRAALAAIPGLKWQIFDEVVPNPGLAQVRLASSVARDHGCDSIIAVGGGSVIDVAKLAFACLAGNFEASELQTHFGQEWLSAAARPDDPLFLAIPTTSGTGSESSSAALIQSDDKRKHLYRSLRTRPALVALQPELTLSLPFRATAQGGFDALLHALGAWVNTSPSPVGKAMALHALRLCMRALPDVLRAPADLRARADMQMGAYLAGVAIGMSKVDAIHAMCTPLEAHVHMAHAEVLAPIFSVVARYTVQTHPRPYAEAAQALGLPGTGDIRLDALALIAEVEALALQARISTRFADLRLTEQNAEQLAAHAQLSASMPLNPRPLAPEEIKLLYLRIAA